MVYKEQAGAAVHQRFYSAKWSALYGSFMYIVTIALLIIVISIFAIWHILAYAASIFFSSFVEKYGEIFVSMIVILGAFCIALFVSYGIGMHYWRSKKGGTQLIQRTSPAHIALAASSFVLLLAVFFIILTQSSILVSRWNSSIGGLTASYQGTFFDSGSGIAKPYTDFPDEVEALSKYTRDCGTSNSTTIETIGASSYVNAQHILLSHSIIGIFAAVALISLMVRPEMHSSKSDNGIQVISVNGGGNIDSYYNMYIALLVLWLIVHVFFWVLDILSISGFLSSGQVGAFFWDKLWLNFVIRITSYFGISFLMFASVVGLLTESGPYSPVAGLTKSVLILNMISIGFYFLLVALLNIGWLWTKNGVSYDNSVPVELTCRMEPEFRDYNAYKVLQITYGTIVLIPTLFTLISCRGKEIEYKG